MNRKDFTHQAKCWQHHDIDRWMRVKPEEVLIDNNVSAHSRIKESRMRNDIEA